MTNKSVWLGGRVLMTLAISLLFAAASPAQERQKGDVRLGVTQDGKFQLRGANGKPLARCQLCDRKLEQRYGKGCEKLKEAKDAKDAYLNPPLCAGTANVTVNALDQILVMKTHVNPFCFVFYHNGQAFQGPCYCYPGETAPAGIACVNQ